MKGSNFLYIILLVIGLYFLRSLWPSDEWITKNWENLVIALLILSIIWCFVGIFYIVEYMGGDIDDIWFTPNWKPIKYLLLPLTIPWTIVLIIIRVFNKYFSTGAAKEHYKHIKILS